MNQMTERDIQVHSRILGWLFIGGHAFFLMIGVFIYVLLNAIGAASRDVEAPPILNSGNPLKRKGGQVAAFSTCCKSTAFVAYPPESLPAG